MSSEKDWKSFRVHERFQLLRPHAIVYSPSGNYLLDCLINHCQSPPNIQDIVIVNIAAGYAKRYTKIKERGEIISCYYWLNDSEIVIITQGGNPLNRSFESVFHRTYALDHKKGIAQLIIKREYLLPRLSRTIDFALCICPNPLTLHNQAFCVVQVGPELVLLPWDTRHLTPSQAPVRIAVLQREVGDLSVSAVGKNYSNVIFGPDYYYECSFGTFLSHLTEKGEPKFMPDARTLLERPRMGLRPPQSAAPSTFYCYKNCIYLQLEDDEQWTIYADRLIKIDLSKLDLSCRRTAFHHDSPEISLLQLTKLTTENEKIDSFSKTWHQGELIVRTPILLDDDQEKTMRVVVVNLKDDTVYGEELPHQTGYSRQMATIYSNKYLVWRDFREENPKAVLQFLAMRGQHLPIQSFKQICWENIYLTNFPDKFCENCPHKELDNLVFHPNPLTSELWFLFRNYIFGVQLKMERLLYN